MRIAYVTSDRGVPVFGTKGASIHVRELARALHALGHELLIVTPRAGGDRPAGFDVPVVETRHDAGATLREFAPDAIYERYSRLGTVGARAARELDVPFLLEVNAPLADEHARYRGADHADEARRLERELVRSADRVIAVSRGVERWLVSLGVDPSRIVVMRNGVDADRFRPQDAVPRAGLGLDDRPVVGFVGTLKPWHDVATLVRALARDGDGLQLLVVGEGPERERLAAMAEAAGVPAAFTGAVAHERVPALLATLDVAVAPYAADDSFYFSPLKLVEYLAAARPVAAADVGEIRHCVRPGETGCLYPPGDAAGLAAAIRALLDDPDGAAALAVAGRAHVRAAHTWEANARAVVELAA